MGDVVAGCHVDQVLFEQRLNDQSRPVLRRVHHTDVGAPLDQPLYEFIFEGHLGAYCDVRYRTADSRQADKQQVFPEPETSADGHGSSKTHGHAYVVAGTLHGAHERGRVGLKGATCGGQSRAGLIAHEQAAAKLLLQCGDSGTDG
ncbi:hypothetical protein D3C71_1069930 [compost metagenome]